MSEQNSGGPVSAQRLSFLLICTCFLLSGFAALLYETVWIRQFAIILGTSEQALAVILGAYMGGLSFGAWVASRKTNSIRRPLLAYGILEAGIAGCALAMPLGLAIVQWLQIKCFGGSTEPPPAGSLPMIAFGLVSAFALILPPTAMMGATLPLLAKYAVRNDAELGQRIGLLYAINTLGAVAGTLSAAFICLPTIGLGRTTWVGAAVNLAVFALVWLGLSESPSESDECQSAKTTPSDSPTAPTKGKSRKSDSSEEPDQRAPYERVLWFAAISGAVSFCYEIIFTRMLGHILGGSIFAFATMLAGFLLGISLGGAIASRLASKRSTAAIYFVYAQALTGIFALAAFGMINQASQWTLESLGGNRSTVAQVVISIAILLPSATCIGATFPLAIRIFAKDHNDASTGSAKVYFWNTIGAIIGSLLTGMIVLPHLAYHGSLMLAIVVNASLALMLVAVMQIPKQHALAGVVTLVVLLIAAPKVPESVLRASSIPGAETYGEFVFNSVGRSATVSVFDQQDGFRFQTNGLPEASVALKGTGFPFSFDGAWLSALPPLVRPGGDTMLIVGLGGGTAASFVPPSIREIDIFELEPAVVDANRSVSRLRRQDPLADDRINIVLNDGRNGLALTTKKYDYIVSQPSHPWTAGASHLYTVEFNQIVRKHLRPKGIFLQWMDIQFVDLNLMRSMTASLLDVFPHARIYEPTPGSLMFVASDQPIEPESVPTAQLEMSPDDLRFYREFGMIKPTNLLARLKMDESALRSFAADAHPITDEFNLFAMTAPHLTARDAAAGVRLQKELAPWEPLGFYPNGLKTICPTVNYRDLADRMRGVDKDQSEQIQSLLLDPVEKALLRSSTAQFRGNIDTWEHELWNATELDPHDPRASCLILSYAILGTLPKPDPETTERLLDSLDDRYRMLHDAVALVGTNNNADIEKLRQYDSQLASFEPDEIGFELAARMRIIWRISGNGPDRERLAAEALDISRSASPSIAIDSIALFEIIAAVQANQPHVALSTIMSLSRSLKQRSKKVRNREIGAPQVQKMLVNLARCRDAISNPIEFRDVPAKRYRNTLLYVDHLLSNYPNVASAN